MAELSKIRKNGVDYDIKDTIARQGKYDYTKQGLPILYLTGDTTGMDKDNAKDMFYVFGERSGTASVKWQGSGSVTLGQEMGTQFFGDANKGKYNYTIKFDTAFEAKAGWGEQKKYCLKANVADFSHARNLCVAKLWGQVSESRASAPLRLWQTPNWGAVDGFPILVVINGEYYGLFTMNIPKDAWMMDMPTAGAMQEAIVCAEVNAAFFSPVTIGNGETFEIEYVTDESNTDWVKTSLDAIVSAVSASDWAALQSVVDIDSAIDYILMVTRLTGGDALARNYLLHTYDGVKWYFTPYDADTWLGINWGGAGHVPDDHYPTFMVCAETNALMNMILTYAPEKVTARCEELENGALSTSNIIETVMDFTAEIPKAVFDAEVVRWPGIETTETNNVQQIVDHIRARETHFKADIAQIDAPMLKPKATWYNATAAGAEMNTITDINFDSNYAVTGNEDASWDCSKNSNGSIMAYRTGTVVTVKPNHKFIKLNPDSSYMFANDGTNASFSLLARITGTEIFTAGKSTSMAYACHKVNKLVTPVYIPRGVITTQSMFFNTWILKKTYPLPAGLLYMNNMFSGGGLSMTPKIPTSVLEMANAFTGTSITKIPTIPEGVISISAAFQSCYKAGGFVEIKSEKITQYGKAFDLAARDTDGIVLVGDCPILAEIAATNTAGKVTVLE